MNMGITVEEEIEKGIEEIENEVAEIGKGIEEIGKERKSYHQRVPQFQPYCVKIEKGKEKKGKNEPKK
jgi:prefoldin subunit 5